MISKLIISDYLLINYLDLKIIAWKSGWTSKGRQLLFKNSITSAIITLKDLFVLYTQLELKFSSNTKIST